MPQDGSRAPSQRLENRERGGEICSKSHGVSSVHLQTTGSRLESTFNPHPIVKCVCVVKSHQLIVLLLLCTAERAAVRTPQVPGAQCTYCFSFSPMYENELPCLLRDVFLPRVDHNQEWSSV